MRFHLLLPVALTVLLAGCAHQNKIRPANDGLAISGTAVMGVGRGEDGQTGLISGVKALKISLGGTFD